MNRNKRKRLYTKASKEWNSILSRRRMWSEGERKDIPDGREMADKGGTKRRGKAASRSIKNDRYLSGANIYSTPCSGFINSRSWSLKPKYR